MEDLSTVSVDPMILANSLAQEENMLFFDTSGNLPKTYKEPLSLLAARPSKVLSGNLSDTSELEEILEKYQTDEIDTAFPTGGLAGWVDYNGDYCFGLYEEFGVYSHFDQRWKQMPFDSFPAKFTFEPQSIAPWRAYSSPQEFEQAVRESQEEIAKGNVYQVNLAQKFETELSHEGSLFDLYRELRASSPAPMSIYGTLGGKEILCSSPETFLQMSGNVVETRPIKGTRPRYNDPEKDSIAAYELLTSQKETSELVMITDLLRNDLGQVCEFGSVSVDELLSHEKLEQVHHMVSTIRGQIKPEFTHLDVLKQCYPGGSITGAPKQSALEIIKRLEPTERGLYTGAVGYLGFNGESQFNIVIRTLIKEGKKLHYHVGAGIVADSVPKEEYEETLAKARGIQDALGQYFQ